MNRWAMAILGLALVATPLAAAADERCPETADRLPGEELTALVEGPMALVDADDFEGGQRAFEQLLIDSGKRGTKTLLADLVMAFGVALHTKGFDDPLYKERAIPYFRQAVGAYTEAFGPEHPETALAWATLGDGAMSISPDDPPQEAVDALERAYAIRLPKFGLVNVETAANLHMLAKANGEPSRTGGDPAKIAASDSMFRQAYKAARSLRCEHSLNRTVPRDHLTMLVENKRTEAAMARFDEIARDAPEEDMKLIAFDFIELLDDHELPAEAESVHARFPDAADEAADALLRLLEILNGQAIPDPI